MNGRLSTASRMPGAWPDEDGVGPVQVAEDRHRLDADPGLDAQPAWLETAVELGEVGDRFAVGHVGSIRASVNRAGRNPFPFAAEYEYSQSVVTDGELVFSAGQGAFGEDGAVVAPDDAEAQIRQAFANLDTVLRAPRGPRSRRSSR